MSKAHVKCNYNQSLSEARKGSPQAVWGGLGVMGKGVPRAGGAVHTGEQPAVCVYVQGRPRVVRAGSAACIFNTVSSIIVFGTAF